MAATWWITSLVFCLLIKSGEGYFNIPNQCDPIRKVKVEYLDKSLEFMPRKSWLEQEQLYLNCSRRGLRHVPRHLNSDVDFLDLQENLITTIEREDFSNMKRLKIVLLVRNCVTRAMMTPGFGRSPVCTKSLKLDLEETSGIRLLVLHYNYIETFGSLPRSLEYLDVSNTALGNLSYDFAFNLPNLTILHASFMCEKSLGSYYCIKGDFHIKNTPFSLRYLNLDYNNWKQVPTHLLSINLRYLDLNSNEIARLRNGDFSEARSLEVLKLANNMPISPMVIEENVFSPLAELTELNLSDNNLEHIQVNLFKNNRKLRVLNLSFNCLHIYIEEPLFLMYLSNLKVLDVSVSSLCSSGPFPFIFDNVRLGSVYSNLTSLESLLLGPQEIQFTTAAKLFLTQYTNLDNTSFKSLRSLPRLEKICLGFSGIQTIQPGTWKGMKYLKTVLVMNNMLGGNEIVAKNEKRMNKHRKTPKVLKTPTKVESLQWKKWNKGVENKTNGTVTVNNYSSNHIGSIQQVSDLFLPKVTVLDLSNNKIGSLSRNDFIRTPLIKEIILSGNMVLHVDHFVMKALNYLQLLHFDGANLVHLTFALYLQKDLPISLSMLGPNMNDAFGAIYDTNKHAGTRRANIYELILSNNNIQMMVQEQNQNLKMFSGIKILKLRSCKIFQFPINFFQGAESVTSLDLSQNELLVIPTLSICDLANLTELRLDHNLISQLNDNLFSLLPRIKILSMSGNNIAYIRPQFFDAALSLQYLDLSHNLISSLDGDVMTKKVLYSLNHLDIRWNIFDCSCGRWDTFYEWYSLHGRIKTNVPGLYPKCSKVIDDFYGGCVSCHSPSAFSGHSLLTNELFTSCDLRIVIPYCVVFTLSIFTFLVAGIVANSKRFKVAMFRRIHSQLRTNWVSRDRGNQQVNNEERHSDVFLLFDTSNHEVGDWVDEKLLPGMLRKPPHFGFTLMGRDVSCGVGQAHQVAANIGKCRKTIFLLSRNFVQTGTFRFALMALEEAEFAQGQRKLIVLSYLYGNEAFPLPLRLQRRKMTNPLYFLTFKADDDNEEIIFEALRTALAC